MAEMCSDSDICFADRRRFKRSSR